MSQPTPIGSGTAAFKGDGKDKEEQKILNIDDSIIRKPENDDKSGDEEEEEDAESLKNMFNVESEDIHMSQK